MAEKHKDLREKQYTTFYIECIIVYNTLMEIEKEQFDYLEIRSQEAIVQLLLFRHIKVGII